MTVMFQVEVFWVVKPRNDVVGYQRFRGPCRLHLQDSVMFFLITNQGRVPGSSRKQVHSVLKGKGKGKVVRALN
jgi:hypothetical protein